MINFDNGEIIAMQNKVHLPNYDVFDEERIFSQGEMPGPMNFRGLKIGVAICEDIWFDDVTECLMETGSELLVILNGSPYNRNKEEKRMNVVLERVVETKLPLIYVNQVGGQDELVFDGGSFVVNETGEMIYQASQFDEEVFHLDLDLLIKRSTDKSNLELRTKSLELESTVSAPTLTENESIYSALKLGLFDYVTKNNFKKVLIGISGGIDSALTAAICVDALGSDNVIGVAMPSKYNSSESLDDAVALSKNLNMELKVIEIEPLVETFRNTLSSAVVDKLSQVTDENIQSRVRGNILMGLSNQTGAMVVLSSLR